MTDVYIPTQQQLTNALPGFSWNKWLSTGNRNFTNPITYNGQQYVYDKLLGSVVQSPYSGTTTSGLTSSLSGIADGASSFADYFGGWGNVFQGISALGNLYTGIQQIGIAKDALSLAKNQYNTSKALMQANLDNSVQSYNTSLADRYRARAYAETGDNSAYDDLVSERSLKSTSL